jgi:hypothetical protein
LQVNQLQINQEQQITNLPFNNRGGCMRILSSIGFVIIIALTLVGCGSGSQSIGSTSTGDIPDWYNNVPKDPNVFFSTSSQVSGDMQLAVDKATSAARTELGRMVETKISGLQKRFTEETGTANNAQLLDMFTQASKNVVSTSLSGTKESKRKIVKDGNNWRAYVMVEYPVGAASEALMQQIKNNEQMFTRFRAAKTFEELDKEVKEYEEAKKKQ